MKKLKKSILFVFVVTAAAVLFCVFAAGAWDFETTYYEYLSRGDTETRIGWVADYAQKKAMVTSVRNWGETSTALVPEKIYVYDDYDVETQFTVTALKPKLYDEPEYDKIYIPKSVTEIENVGYLEDWVGYEFWYDENDDNFEPEITKIENFTIVCVKGSFAETYAKKNGFNIEYIYEITENNISLGADSFIFTGEDIEPSVTVTVEGKTLTQGTDYTVSFENNFDVGTAYVEITGRGNYIGSVKKAFSIIKVPAEKVTIDVDETVFEYDGSTQKLYFDVMYNEDYLYEGEDYKVAYSNNTYPGTATATLTFIGKRYSGTRTFTFKIIIPQVTDAQIEANADATASLSWSFESYWFCKISRFDIYRYDAKQKKYVYIGKAAAGYFGSFTDKNTAQLTKYTYKIVPVLSANKKTYGGAAVTVSVMTPLLQPSVTGVLYKNSIKLKWKKNAKADGYIIYRRTVKKTSLSGAKKVGTLNKNTLCTFTDKTISPKYNYYYTVRAYKKIGNKTYYSLDGSFCRSDTPSTILAGAQLKKRDSIKVYNTQGAKTTSYTYTISKRDMQVLKKFADKHFKKNMSREEKLRYTLNWINKNVIYATGNDWNKICSKGYADAVFTYKLGQCVQYNGAMAEMMAYLGYDAYLIQGYRGSRSTGRIWQHFWCEVNINGRVYLMETGNYDCDGNWHYFLTPYSETSGYIKNKKFLGY